jgi:exopolysaccharide production protein ExoZ
MNLRNNLLKMQSAPLHKPNQLAAIQVLRGLAAFAVVAVHAIQEVDKMAKRVGSSFPHEKTLPLAAGVDLFFVISGFVMVYASRDMFGSSHSIGPFLHRRAARIIPIYWLATTVYIGLSVLGLAPLNRVAPDLYEVVTSYLFIPYPRPDGLIQPIYSLGWTLNYEMFFYCLFALVLPFRRSIAVPLLVGILLLLVTIGLFVPSSAAQFKFWTQAIILEFGAGMIVAQLALQGFKPQRSVAYALIAAALIYFALAPSLLPASLHDRAILFGIPSAALVVASLSFNDLDYSGFIGRWLIKLGDSSYALYIMHPFALRGLAVVAGLALTRISPWLFIIACLVAACVMAHFVYLWFERPVTKALQGSKKS